MVTSPNPREGKSTVVANLALAFAETGRRVLVVDGNIRKPRLHHVFGVSNEVGLSSILIGEIDLNEAVHVSIQDPGVHVLPSGHASSNPSQLLSSPGAIEVLRQITAGFDVVLLDTPSVLTVADAETLASAVDGVLLVVERARTQETAANIAHQRLACAGANVIGIVVNRAARAPSFWHYRNGRS
jgi:capsular exopolysaccharide synthesis family protein